MMFFVKHTLGGIFLFWIFCCMLPSLAAAQAPEILWWYDLDAPSFGSAAVGDIDGDGLLEIVFGTYFNDEHIYALNAEDGSLLWKYGTGGCNDASPAIADVDQDGELEVVVPASSPCMVYCFNGATGGVEWSTSTGSNCIDSPPAVADVDNDGKPEVIFGTFNGYVYCLNGENGSQRWRVNVGTDSFIQSGPNIVDLNGDRKLDVVVAQWAGDYRVYALRGGNGSVLWYCDLPNDHMYHGGSIADIDEDGKPEIAIGCYDNHLYVLKGEDGSLEWDYTASYYIGAPTSIGDLDNDGHLEIVFVSYNQVKALTYTGGLLWSRSVGGNVFRGVALADINGNGILDVVFGCDDGILRALRGNNGVVMWTYDLEAHYGNTFEMDHAPVIADFDRDGKLDIFIVGGYGTSSNPALNHGRAYALSAGNGTGPGWTMFRHDLRHSACFDDPWISTRFGNVNLGNGSREVVLRFNGSAGDEWRVCTIPSGTAAALALEAPSAGPNPADFSLYVIPYEPGYVDTALQPYSIGTSCMPMPLSNGNVKPLPYTVANTIGYPTMLGYPILPGIPPAPCTIFDLPSVPPGIFAFQGYIFDNGSVGYGVSLTNAIVLKVQ